MRIVVACLLAMVATVHASLNVGGLTVNVGSQPVSEYVPRLVGELEASTLDVIYFALQECTEPNPDLLGDAFVKALKPKYEHAVAQPVVSQGDDFASGKMGKTVLIVITTHPDWRVADSQGLNVDLSFHPRLTCRKTADPITGAKQPCLGEANNKGAACIKLNLEHVAAAADDGSDLAAPSVVTPPALRGGDAAAAAAGHIALSIVDVHMSFKGGTLHRARAMAAAALACSYDKGQVARTTVFAGDFNGRGAYMKPSSFMTLADVRENMYTLSADAAKSAEQRTEALMTAMGDETRVLLNGGVPPAALPFLDEHLPAGGERDPQLRFKLYLNGENKIKFFTATPEVAAPADAVPIEVKPAADKEVVSLTTFTLAELFKLLQLREPKLDAYAAPTYKRLPAAKCGKVIEAITSATPPTEAADGVTKGHMYTFQDGPVMWCQPALADTVQADLEKELNAKKTIANHLVSVAATCDRGRCFHVKDVSEGKHMPAATDRVLVDPDMEVASYGPVYPRGTLGDHNVVRFVGIVGRADVAAVRPAPMVKEPSAVSVHDEESEESAETAALQHPEVMASEEADEDADVPPPQLPKLVAPQSGEEVATVTPPQTGEKETTGTPPQTGDDDKEEYSPGSAAPKETLSPQSV